MSDQIGRIAAGIVNGIRKDTPFDGGKITVPGVYSGVPIDRYHGDPTLFDGFSISSTGVREVLDRPLKFWFHSIYNPDRIERESNPAFEFGKAAHMLLLGEAGFAERYVLRPKKAPDGRDWNGNNLSCKLWLEEQQSAGRSIVTQTDIDHIRQIASALQRKELVRHGLLNGRIERTIAANIGGVWCKSRPDAIPNSDGQFVDLKTAASVDDESLATSIYRHGYHVQAGFMRMVVRAVLGEDAFSGFTFVFVEKGPPYDVRIMQLKDTDIDLGERQARHGLRILRDCIKSGRWPGYDGDDIARYVEMPSWAKTRIDNQLREMEAA